MGSPFQGSAVRLADVFCASRLLVSLRETILTMKEVLVEPWVLVTARAPSSRPGGSENTSLHELLNSLIIADHCPTCGSGRSGRCGG